MTAIERYADTEEGLAVFERRLNLLERQAGILAKSLLVPRAFRGKPQEIMAAGLSLMGVGVEVSPVSLKHCFVVDGTVNFDAQLQIGLAGAQGHQMYFPEADERHAVCCIQLDGQDRVHRYTYTIDMARRLLDEWVENWTGSENSRRLSGKYTVSTDGVRNEDPPPEWAAKLIAGGQVKRKDPWHTAREAMLMCRAATRAVSKTCPGVMFGLGVPTGGRVPPVGVDIDSGELVVEDDDVVDAELVDDARQDATEGADGPGGQDSGAAASESVPATEAGRVTAGAPAGDGPQSPSRPLLVDGSWTRRLAIACSQQGLDRDQRLALVSHAIGRPVETSKAVQQGVEAEQVADLVHRLAAGEVTVACTRAGLRIVEVTADRGDG